MSYLKNIRIFLRVVELGSISAAGRDQRVSAAVASNRIKELEKYLGVRLFNRTTRQLTATEHGNVFYTGAQKIVDAVDEAEAAVADIAKNPKGSLLVMSQLGVGKRIIAPLIPEFRDLYPEIEVRLRLTDRDIDLTSEGVDVAFQLGLIEDSNLRLRSIMDCERMLCAAPEYLEKFGTPKAIEDLKADGHHCLLLRFPGSKEFSWTFSTADGPKRIDVFGPYDSDDGDVLTEWALAGRGIVNKPRFEVSAHLAAGELVPVLEEFRPTKIKFACLYPHRRFQDPKVRLFIDFMVERSKARIAEIRQNTAGPTDSP